MTVFHIQDQARFEIQRVNRKNRIAASRPLCAPDLTLHTRCPMRATHPVGSTAAGDRRRLRQGGPFAGTDTEFAGIGSGADIPAVPICDGSDVHRRCANVAGAKG